jgi:hypothetical protein
MADTLGNRLREKVVKNKVTRAEFDIIYGTALRAI